MFARFVRPAHVAAVAVAGGALLSTSPGLRVECTPAAGRKNFHELLAELETAVASVDSATGGAPAIPEGASTAARIAVVHKNVVALHERFQAIETAVLAEKVATAVVESSAEKECENPKCKICEWYCGSACAKQFFRMTACVDAVPEDRRKDFCVPFAAEVSECTMKNKAYFDTLMEHMKNEAGESGDAESGEQAAAE